MTKSYKIQRCLVIPEPALYPFFFDRVLASINRASRLDRIGGPYSKQRRNSGTGHRTALSRKSSNLHGARYVPYCGSGRERGGRLGGDATMTKYRGIQDPELVEMLNFFDPPLTDDDGG